MSAFIQQRSKPAVLPGPVLGLNFQLPWLRIAKISAAVSVLAIGSYAVMADQIAIATDNAVVSAYSVALRTPIEGAVAGKPLRIGDKVSQGAILAKIDNNRVDNQRLVDLQQHLTRARAQLAAIAAEMAALEAAQADLERRAAAYVKASTARIEGSVAEAENTLAAQIVRRDLAARRLNRRVTLSDKGFSAKADLDQAQSDFDAASREVAAQQGRLDALHVQLTAGRQGVISEPGSNDVAYSQQRADEIAIRLKDLAQQHAVTIADVEETAGRLDGEENRVAKLSVAPIIAPTSGIVWKVNATSGERIGAGETVVQIVDCDAAFIIAEVPQNRVPNIEVGNEAEFRLSGDNVKRHGRVLSVTGDATGGERNLAAIPFDGKGLTATVRIAMEPSGGECFVGRTARVLLPSSGPGFFSRLFNRFG